MSELLPLRNRNINAIAIFWRLNTAITLLKALTIQFWALTVITYNVKYFVSEKVLSIILET